MLGFRLELPLKISPQENILTCEGVSLINAHFKMFFSIFFGFLIPQTESTKYEQQDPVFIWVILFLSGGVNGEESGASAPILRGPGQLPPTDQPRNDRSSWLGYTLV